MRSLPTRLIKKLFLEDRKTKFKDININEKLIIGFSFVIVFTALIGALGLYNLQKIKYAFDSSIKTDIIAKTMGEIRTLLAQEVRSVEEYIGGWISKEKTQVEINKSAISLSGKLTELNAFLGHVEVLTEKDISGLESVIEENHRLVKKLLEVHDESLYIMKNFGEQIENLDEVMNSMSEQFIHLLPIIIKLRNNIEDEIKTVEEFANGMASKEDAKDKFGKIEVLKMKWTSELEKAGVDITKLMILKNECDNLKQRLFITKSERTVIYKGFGEQAKRLDTIFDSLHEKLPVQIINIVKLRVNLEKKFRLIEEYIVSRYSEKEEKDKEEEVMILIDGVNSQLAYLKKIKVDIFSIAALIKDAENIRKALFVAHKEKIKIMCLFDEQIEELRSVYYDLSRNHPEKIGILTDTIINFNEWARLVKKYVGGWVTKEAVENDIEAYKEAWESNLEDTRKGRIDTDKSLALISNVKDIKERLFDYQGRGDLLMGSFDENVEKIDDAMDLMFQIEQRKIFMLATRSVLKTITFGRVITAIFFALSILAVVGSIIFISRSVTHPIIKLAKTINKVGMGNMSLKAEIDSKDELGQLAASFNKMTKDLQKVTVSKDYLDNIIENMTDTLIVVNPDATIRTVNQATCNLLEYKKDELIGKPINIIIEEVFETLMIEDLIKKGLISGIEKTYLSKNGCKIPVLFSGSVMCNDTGQIQWIVCVAQDITERKQVGEKIEHLASFPQLITNPILEVNSSGVISFCNNAAIKVLKKLGLKKDINVFLPEDINEIIKGLEQKKEAQLYREVEIEGHTFAENIHLVSEFNVVRIYTQDITKRKLAEKHIRKFYRVTEQSPSVVLISDVDGYIEYVNPKFTKLSGYTAEEVIGKNPRLLKSGLLSPKIYEILWATITTGNEWRGEFQNKKKNGELYWEAASISPIRSPEGIITNFIKVAEDITRRKAAEEGLIKARDELEEKVEKRTAELKITNEQLQASLMEKELLLKEVHHRVKNNMQIIMSLLKTQSRYINDKQSVNIFQDCQGRIESMALIHEKLYHSQDLSNVDFKDYIKNLTNSLFSSYGINTSKIALKMNVEDVSLGIDTAIPCALVLNELITNSLKYAFPIDYTKGMPEDKKGEILIFIRLFGKTGLELIVSDNGIGIPADIDFRNTKSLGLQLVTGVVENQLGGTIEIDRSKGTRIQIRFKKTG